MRKDVLNNERGCRYVYCRYITRNGKKIYPKNGKVFRFPVKG